ncbi:putative DNA-binding protein [Oxobacter pfennigii]|uniref:UPF0122 protein OXPF_21010 n=1 Tax=Oxobacter pfennigii TaxID=36849 RepID=A0A0N8NT61_9CLOT|nr:putative DNA-binding protein [Oxobacter pfennigii]KPU43936.1 putative DNA-binding protein [Oxobacter pfennigii]
MDKVLEISLLYDFYGQMLTDKQRDIIELYYNNDLSLSEISEAVNTSRQGVYDLLKRSEKILYNYEEKLKLLKKFMDHKNKVLEAYKLLDDMGNSPEVNKVKEILGEIIETEM